MPRNQGLQDTAKHATTLSYAPRSGGAATACVPIGAGNPGNDQPSGQGSISTITEMRP